MSEGYFATYFNLIATVACDKAREHLEKKNNIVPTALQLALVQLAQCEKSYCSLAFLEQKWFGRRDPLKNTYQTLHNDSQVIMKQFGSDTSAKQDNEPNREVISVVAESLMNFCACRMECIEVYICASRAVTLEELEKSITNLIQRHKPNLQHQMLKPVLDSFLSEFETFRLLVGTNILIAEWNFFTSLIELHKIHQTLAIWQPFLVKDQHHTYSFRSGIFGFGEKHSTSPIYAIYQWMAKYFQSLVSKFSFYFYECLSRQAKPDETKMLFCKTSYDFVTKALNFSRKLDSSFVLLGAVANENTSRLIDDSLKTTHAKILELPVHPPDFLWPSLDVLLYNKSEEITFEKVVYYFDKHIDFTFYAAQCDPGIILVVAVCGKKSEKDSYVSNFISETITHLRPKKVFSLLRPGSK